MPKKKSRMQGNGFLSAKDNEILAAGLTAYNDKKYRSLGLEQPPYSFFLLGTYFQNFIEKPAIMILFESARIKGTMELMSTRFQQLKDKIEETEDIVQKRNLLLEAVMIRNRMEDMVSKLEELNSQLKALIND